MYRKLNLDRDKVDQCRESAKKGLAPLLRYIKHHSSVSIERASLSFLGVRGDMQGVPLANRFVETLGRDRLRIGVSPWLGRLMASKQLNAQQAAEGVVGGTLTFDAVADMPVEKARGTLQNTVETGFAKLEESRVVKEALVRNFVDARAPIKRLPIPYDNRRHDNIIRAVQSDIDLLALEVSPESMKSDSLAHSVVEELEQLRFELDTAGKHHSSFFRLGVDGNGLTGPELAVIAGQLRVDVIRQDPFSAILFYDINPKRAFVDHTFSQAIAAKAGMVVMTGEEKILASIDAYRHGHQALASHFFNEQLAIENRLPLERFAPSFAFEVDTDQEEGFLAELATAQAIRELFPRSPVHVAAPARKEGVLLSEWRMPMLHMAGLLSEQTIHTISDLGPTIRDRWTALEIFNIIAKNTKNIGDELLISSNGKIARRAHTILENTLKLLRKCAEDGLFQELNQRMLAGKGVDERGGVGLEGVFQKDRRYFNPVVEHLQS